MKKIIFILSITLFSCFYAIGSVPLAGAFGDNGCSSGGPGSSECSVTTTVAGSGVTYSVKCQSGYYACCNGLTGAKCVKG